MKRYELLICCVEVKKTLEEKTIHAENIKSLFEYFNSKHKGFRIAFIHNASTEEMSELRKLEENSKGWDYEKHLRTFR